MTGISRSYLQKLLKEQAVFVNGKPVKANYKIQPETEICLEIPDMEPLDIKPEAIPLDILYEDDYLLVVNKPKGMVVHPAAGHTEGTLVNAVMAHSRRPAFRHQRGSASRNCSQDRQRHDRGSSDL